MLRNLINLKKLSFSILNRIVWESRFQTFDLQPLNFFYLEEFNLELERSESLTNEMQLWVFQPAENLKQLNLLNLDFSHGIFELIMKNCRNLKTLTVDDLILLTTMVLFSFLST